MLFIKKLTGCFLIVLSFYLIIIPASFAKNIKISKVEKVSSISLHNKLLYIKGNNIYVSDPLSGEHREITKTNDVTNFSISHDLSKIVLVRDYKKLFIMDVITGNEKFIANIETDVSSPSISPCNNKIVITNRSKRKFNTSKYSNESIRHVWLFDLNERRNMDLTEKSEKPCSAPQWSPDGKQISLACMSTTKEDWYVYTILEPGLTNKKSKEIAPGFNSLWLNDKTIMIGNMFSLERGAVIYDLENSKIIKEIRFNSGVGLFKFSFKPPDNLYYEDGRENPDLDIGLLNISTLKQDIIIRDAKSPIYCK